MLKVGAGVVLAVMVTAALAPPSASAQIVPLPLPNVAEALEEIFGAPANLVGEGAAKLAVEAFEGILTALFGFPAKLITKGLLTWLTEVPNFTGGVDPATGRATGSQVAELGRVTSSLAFAAMGAVATVSIIRYWAAGVFQGSGGLEALEGLARTVVAAFAIVLWPWFYGRSVGLANAASSALLGSSEVLENTTALLAAAFRAGIVLNVLTVIVAFAAAILFLALLLTKIVVSASSVVLYDGMPAALMLWAIPELAWIARAAMRGMFVLLAIPFTWALCFAAFGALSVDAFTLRAGNGVVNALIAPLVALAMLWIVVTMPRALARTAMLGAASAAALPHAPRAIWWREERTPPSPRPCPVPWAAHVPASQGDPAARAPTSCCRPRQRRPLAAQPGQRRMARALWPTERRSARMADRPRARGRERPSPRV